MTKKVRENNTIRFYFPVNKEAIEIIKDMTMADDKDVGYVEAIALLPIEQAIEVFRKYEELNSKDDYHYSRYFAGQLETSSYPGGLWFVIKPITTYFKGRAVYWGQK